MAGVPHRLPRWRRWHSRFLAQRYYLHYMLVFIHSQCFSVLLLKNFHGFYADLPGAFAVALSAVACKLMIPEESFNPATATFWSVCPISLLLLGSLFAITGLLSAEHTIDSVINMHDVF